MNLVHLRPLDWPLRRFCLQVALMMAALVFAQAVHAQALWGRAQAGMSADALKREYPGARLADKNAKQYVEGFDIFLLGDESFAGESMNVYAVFDGERLWSLMRDSRVFSRHEEAGQAFMRVIEALRSTYGAEKSRIKSAGGEMFRWALPEGEVVAGLETGDNGGKAFYVEVFVGT